VTLGRRRIHARVLDVSEGGLCIVTPVRFNRDTTVHIVIDVPRIGPVAVRGVVRHKRRFRQPSSGRRGWATGLALREAAPEFLAIAKPGAGLPEARYTSPLELLDRSARTTDGAIEPELLETEDSDAPRVYRIRLKAIGSTRTRELTLSAHSEEAVCEAVLTDLPGDWEIVGLETDPLD
jgi:hypothetical protein